MQSEVLGDLKVNAWQWLGKQQSGATQVILTPSKAFVIQNNPNHPSICPEHPFRSYPCQAVPAGLVFQALKSRRHPSTQPLHEQCLCSTDTGALKRGNWTSVFGTQSHSWELRCGEWKGDRVGVLDKIHLIWLPLLRLHMVCSCLLACHRSDCCIVRRGLKTVKSIQQHPQCFHTATTAFEPA